MTFTVKTKRTSSPFRISRMKRMFRRSLAVVGLLSITTFVLLATNSTICNQAANVLNGWATAAQAKTKVDEMALAPFEFDDLEVPLSVNKVSTANIEALPVLAVSELTSEQAKVAKWIANRYRVAPEMVAYLVQEAWEIGLEKKLDPTLFLAIIAIESRYNPYAQSTVGATGLMQVMTNVHAAKLERTGGAVTVFDPITNLRVGVQILEEHVKRAGSLQTGLKHYSGATGPTDNGYGAKVFAERDRIRQVIFGHKNPTLDAILNAGVSKTKTAKGKGTESVS